jgi:adenine phosphoribosyltransferase
VLDAAVMTADAKRDPTHLRALKAAGLRVQSPPASQDDPFDLKPLIRTVHDFPKKGIAFRDITTLLESPQGFHRAVKALAERYRTQKLDHVLGIDARGFIFGGALAYELGCGFIPVRKKGKLPGTTLKMEYALEYGTDAVELREGCLAPDDQVVVVDDLIATGGTAEAAVKLASKMGAKVHEAAFVIELPDLKGRERLKKNGVETYSLVSFEGH